MQKSFVYRGEHLVTTADVELSAQGCIEKVVVDAAKFHAVDAAAAESQRLWVLEDCLRHGWDCSPSQAIARGISRVISSLDGRIVAVI
jgi:hypothetical protein